VFQFLGSKIQIDQSFDLLLPGYRFCWSHANQAYIGPLVPQSFECIQKQQIPLLLISSSDEQNERAGEAKPGSKTFSISIGTIFYPIANHVDGASKRLLTQITCLVFCMSQYAIGFGKKPEIQGRISDMMRMAGWLDHKRNSPVFGGGHGCEAT
jgi:hypothetical protein